MDRSNIERYLTLHDGDAGATVTFRDLIQLANDDVSHPDHVATREKNQAEIIERREVEAGIQAEGASPFTPSYQRAAAAPEFDYDKLAEAIERRQAASK